MMNADATITSALKDAIEYCRMMFDAEMSTVVPGSRVTREAEAWRRRATEYQKLRKALTPRAKGETNGDAGNPKH